MINGSFQSIEYLIWGIIGALWVLQLVYLWVLYNGIYRQSRASRKELLQYTDGCPPLSVIVTAYNQDFLLKENLPKLLHQDYPDFEVIVVDDNSSDDTKDVLYLMQQEYANLYSTFTSSSVRYISRKKLALTLGIKASKKEWVVFTEPNCYPTSSQWLRQLARNFVPEVDAVIGYSNYEKVKGHACFNQTFDTLLQAMRFLGMAILHRGYMGIGRNMAYRKELFFKNKGFCKHLNLERGEDDLFLNENIPSQRIRAEVSAASVVRYDTKHPNNWTEEKVNRLVTRQYFRGAANCLLGMETFTRLLFYLAIMGTIVIGILSHWWITIGVAVFTWIVRYVCQLIVFSHTEKVLEERRFLASLPLFDVLQPLWELYFHIRKLLTSKREYQRRSA